MGKESLSADRARELIAWWHQIDRTDRKTRQTWQAVYEHHNLAKLPFRLRLKLDLIALVNSHTMPKNAGGTNDA